MKFSVAALALAATVSASYYNASSISYVSYTTEVVSSYETYCPYATTLTYGEHTYTVSEVRWILESWGGHGMSRSSSRLFATDLKGLDNWSSSWPPSSFPRPLSWTSC